MNDGFAPTRFNVGEITIGEKIHADTGVRLDCTENTSEWYEVEGKLRPMLVVNTPRSKIRVYQTLDFTTKRPMRNDPDFFLQDNGKPRCFGKDHGLKKPSFLRVYPLGNITENKMKPAEGTKPFDKDLMDAILKICASCLLRTS